MQGVNSMFDAMRSYESAVKCNPADTSAQLGGGEADEACRVAKVLTVESSEPRALLVGVADFSVSSQL